MAKSESPRRALTDLPINALTIHHLINSSNKDAMSPKRPIDQVEDLDPQRSAIPPRLYHQSVRQDSPRKELSKENVPESSLEAVKCPTLEVSKDIEDLGEESSQNSSTGSISTITDFEFGNETTASQETVQTEISQAAESPARLHAETLRLRLRVALFKVQTNQTNIPMSQLEITTKNGLRSSEIALAPSPKRYKPTSKLLPVPTLLPTAYSARMMPQVRFPSSPPQSNVNSPATLRSASIFETPKIPQHRRQDSRCQLSSPPGSL